MTVVEAHHTPEGYEMTARLMAPNGAKLVFTAKGLDFDEVRARVIAMIDRLLPPEDQGKASQ